ncbi:MAG TPA: glycosyltransferase [Xanthobacteraceae bacterium]|jgi:glycosyltransferase involved in cell wall biosynthesis
MLEHARPTVSIIIKAFNEERNIGPSIESALAALEGMQGEVILADGASTDRTVAIALEYPIKVVRLNRVQDRSCGAGAQLGFQHSSGKYVCHMDADMRLRRDYLAAAVQFLEQHAAVAGVGGLTVDHELGNLEFAQRTRRHDPDRGPGRVTRLNGSGVYRRSTIVSVGYLTDRNLHGGEELDLGARLHSRGWQLFKLDLPAVDHYGHTGSAYRLLLHRFLMRNSFGPGELFRAALGKPHFTFTLRNDRNLTFCFLVMAWWAGMAALLLVLPGVMGAIFAGLLFLLPFAAMSLRWRSLDAGIYSVAVWNALALSFLPGFARRRHAPTSWIDSTVLKHGSRLDSPRIPRKLRGMSAVTATLPESSEDERVRT